MTEQEKLIKAKIPGKETGIEIKKTICDICTPGPQCGIDAYVKDGVVIKVEGSEGFPSNNGKLCTKGAANREYIYRADRIRTPLRRTGPRGSGEFEPISWEAAYAETAEKLNKIKAEYGPEAVVWMTGYSKWFRPWLHRLAHSFGSLNYLTESSTCHRAEVMSHKTLFGRFFIADIPNAKLIIAWGSNGVVNSYPMGRALMRFRENGGRMIVIDPRMTQTAQKMADIYIRPRIGTDGALAHAMARIIIENGWTDDAFIEKNVHGYEKYRDYVMNFDLAYAEEITGVKGEDIYTIARLFATTDPSTIITGNGLTHRINGYNLHRSIVSLLAITGRVDRSGTILPEAETFCHSSGGFTSLEDEFVDEVRPVGCKPAVGSQRFPLWADMVDEGQAMDLVHQINTEEPYPIKAMACFGVNNRMFPESDKLLDALKKLDFVLATDIFDTDVCRHADIVLPVSTSFERSEIKCYAGQFVYYTQPAIAPVYDNKDDVEIITELARYLDLKDDLLVQGYDACVRYIFSTSGIEDWEEVRTSPKPVRAPNAKPYIPGTYLSRGVRTPTGKIELYSEAVAKYSSRGLDPLPVYTPGYDDADPDEFLFTLMAGARIPNAIHSRAHDVPWLRSLRPEPSADINRRDAEKMGIADGDDIELATSIGKIVVKANLTELSNEGDVNIFHGYRNANINGIIPDSHLDPYTGFPGYKQVRCKISKVRGGRI
ncbi:MAG: molybdopterin-dependent oxidoreductase [Clostridiales bacterium]|nr:molybdopterin-dependent oxidoreductase [Clostridiales bacterium]